MKKMKFLIWFILITGNCFAQNAERILENYENWETGYIFFKDGREEKHVLNYSPFVHEGLLQVKSEGKLYTLTVMDIDGFEYYDASKNKDRKFLVFPIYSKYTRLTRKYFCEVLYENRAMIILNRPALEFRDQVVPRSYNKPAIVNSFYLVDKESRSIEALSKKGYLEMTTDFSSEMKAYLKTTKNRLKEVDDYINALKYYENLKYVE